MFRDIMTTVWKRPTYGHDGCVSTNIWPCILSSFVVKALGYWVIELKVMSSDLTATVRCLSKTFNP